MPSDFSSSLMIELIHRRRVQAEVASGLVEVVASGSEGHFASDSVASEGGSGYPVLVHEACDVVWIEGWVLATSYHPKCSQWSELPKFRG